VASLLVAERLAAKRAEIGSAIFDLQYQNDPSGMDGNIFKRAWFNWVDSVPDGARRVGLDLAASKSERSDYTAAVEVVEDHSENALYVVGAFAARLDEGHRRWLTGRTDDGTYVETVGDNPPGPRLLWPIKMLPPFFAGATGYPEVPRPLTALNIEATAHQSTFVREILGQTRLPARPVYPDKDKVTRARTLAARFEGRKVYFLRGGPGMGTGPTDLGDLARQLLAFPTATTTTWWTPWDTPLTSMAPATTSTSPARAVRAGRVTRRARRCLACRLVAYRDRPRSRRSCAVRASFHESPGARRSRPRGPARPD
jgi:phage terminase large subunit-like protein